MNKKMNKTVFTQELATRTGLPLKQSKQVIETFIDLISEQIEQNDSVVFMGFGSFKPRRQASRIARNPKNGEPVMIPTRNNMYFKPGVDLLKRLNNKPE